MTLSDYEKVLLAIVIYREARGDGTDGMVAVGSVIANRVKAGWGGWVSVITKKNQFSSMSVIGDSQTVIWPSDEPMLWNMAEGIYLGDVDDPTQGALWYANEDNITSDWYKREIIDSGEHTITAKIGKQTFRR